MKYVVDIPEDVYTRLFDNGIQDNEIAVDDVCEMARAIRKGKPLPKGHGRLIDADKLESRTRLYAPRGTEGLVMRYADLQDAPTIIEADEEETEDFICDYGGDCENCEWTTCPDSEVERE